MTSLEGVQAVRENVKIIGTRERHLLRDFLSRGDQPDEWLEADDAQGALARHGVKGRPLPFVLIDSETALVAATPEEAADTVGVGQPPRAAEYGPVIVGAGPAGLAAAVHAAGRQAESFAAELLSLGGAVAGGRRDDCCQEIDRSTGESVCAPARDPRHGRRLAAPRGSGNRRLSSPWRLLRRRPQRDGPAGRPPDRDRRRRVAHGGTPRTAWAARQNLLTDSAARVASTRPFERPPRALESSVPDSFAAGDVPHGSIRRAGGAACEGAMAVALDDAYLADRG